VAALVGGLALGACGLLPASGPVIHLDNLTSSALTVEVKGSWVGTYASGTSVDIPIAGHGAPPYMVTVKSPNGTLVRQLEVTAEDVKSATDNSGSMWGDTELPCGFIRLGFGRMTETPPPARFAGLPACD
jgi:hypothetical protein